jgi:predicted DNA-binding transcriptional regulator AlpA
MAVVNFEDGALSIDAAVIGRGLDVEPSLVQAQMREGKITVLLRVSQSWLAKARMRGDGPPFVKIGRSIRYRESDLLQWMKSRTHLSTSERD